MIAFADVLVIGAMTLVSLLGAAWLMLLRERRLTKSGPRPRWEVKVVPAKKAVDDWDYGYRGEPVEGEFAVRLVRGKEQTLIGIAKLADEDFDEKLAKLRLKAEDRATTLNAVEDEGS